jgi:hypothetical protein
MAIWLVKATWIEDEAEAAEQWAVNAETAYEAVRDVTTRLRFQPHHVEARVAGAGDGARSIDLPPGQAQRVAPS